MNKILNFAAKVAVAAAPLYNAGLWQSIKDFICWCFDRDCYPGKHNIPGWEDISSFFNMFM